MSDREQLNLAQERIEMEAADWVGKLDRGISAAEEDALLDWVALDPRHGECLAELKANWDDFDALDEWRPVDSKLPNPDLLKRPLGGATDRKTVGLWGGAAAAAAVVFGFLALFYSESPRETSSLLASGEFASSYERHVLEDGSTVELNQGAQVEVLFSSTERRLKLIQGEAHFSVSHNPNRPFVVVASNAEVVAVGTAFSVKLESRYLEVLVTEGKVNFEPSNVRSTESVPSSEADPLSATIAKLLEAGQRAVQDLDKAAFNPDIFTVSSEEVESRMAWKDIILDFDMRPLSEVVSAFNRHNHTQIVIGDEELLDMKVTVALKPNNLEAFTRLLKISAGIEALDQGNGTLLLKQR